MRELLRARWNASTSGQEWFHDHVGLQERPWWQNCACGTFMALVDFDMETFGGSLTPWLWIKITWTGVSPGVVSEFMFLNFVDVLLLTSCFFFFFRLNRRESFVPSQVLKSTPRMSSITWSRSPTRRISTCQKSKRSLKQMWKKKTRMRTEEPI